MKTIYNKYSKCVNIINKIYLYIACIVMIVMVFSCILQVFTRYVLNSAMRGTDEVATYTFVWATMMALPLCTRHRSHATVGILTDSLKGKPRQYLSILLDILTIVVIWVLLRYGIKIIGTSGKQLSPVLRIRMKYVFMAVPVGAANALLNVICQIAEDVSEAFFDISLKEGTE